MPTATVQKPGSLFQGERGRLVNPQRGVFKLRQMRFLEFSPRIGATRRLSRKDDFHTESRVVRSCPNEPQSSSTKAGPAHKARRHAAAEILCGRLVDACVARTNLATPLFQAAPLVVRRSQMFRRKGIPDVWRPTITINTA
jgi:hypothetical protein